LKSIRTIKLSTDINDHEYFDNADWLIITGEEQRLYWKESGCDLPAVNFKETFIILSIRKINALYKEKGCDVVQEYLTVLPFTTT
jgi:hypothetical protein